MAVFCGLAVVVSLTGFANPAFAAKAKTAAMVIDANTGKVLHSENGYAQRYPASLTKIMTLYMAFELIEQGRMSYNTLITVSANAAKAPPSKLGLKPGSRISFRNAAKALVTKSANDIAVAVAEHIGGSESNFARLMTRKARAIGMRNTTFRNASGLPNAQQKTTARDMLTLSLRLQDEFPKHYRIFKTRTFSYRGKTYRSHNTLLKRFAGTDGIKTGYTRASGFNLVSSVRRDGKHIVAAVFGGKTARVRNAKMRALLTKNIKKASRRKTRRKYPQLIAKAKPAKRPARRKAVAKKTQAQPKRIAKKPTATPSIQIANVRPVQTVRIAPPPQPPALAPTPSEPKPTWHNANVASQNENRRYQDGASRHANQANADDRYQPGQTIKVLPPSVAAQHLDGRSHKTRARQPSTLQAQMAALEAQPQGDTSYNASPNVRRYLPNQRRRVYAAPSQPPAAPRRRLGNFVIQVGAYRSQSEADNRLTAVSRSTQGLLRGYQHHTERVISGQRSMYRARFAGFDAASASSTCTELRRRGIDCFVKRKD